MAKIGLDIELGIFKDEEKKLKAYYAYVLRQIVFRTLAFLSATMAFIEGLVVAFS